MHFSPKLISWVIMVLLGGKMQNLPEVIENAYKQIHQLSPLNSDSLIHSQVLETLSLLDQGKISVVEKTNGEWKVNQWVKQAILLYFRLTSCKQMPGFNQFYDKIPLKFNHYDTDQLQCSNIRIVPPASVRYGAHIESNTVLMPSFVNIGAYRRIMCLFRKKRSSLRRSRNRRSSRTTSSHPYHRRRQLLYRRTVRDSWRRYCWKKFRYLHGSFHWSKHAYI